MDKLSSCDKEIDKIKNGNNFTGFKVKPNDPQALSIAIKQSIIMDKKDLTKMHERAISNVKNNFSLENMCKKTLEVYKRLLISEWISWHDIFRRQS